MLLAANTKNLAAAFPELPRADVKRLADMIKHAGSHRSVDEALNMADTLLNGHGIEAIRGGSNRGGYYMDIEALYVNMGDAYANTVLYDVARDKFYVTTYGDWVEARERGGLRLAGLGSFGCGGRGSLASCGK